MMTWFWIVLVLLAVQMASSMRCRLQKPTFATCNMQGQGNTMRGNIRFMQPSSCYGFDEPMTVEVDMPELSRSRRRRAPAHHMAVMQFGDISQDCRKTGPIYNPDVFNVGSDKRHKKKSSSKSKQPVGYIGEFPGSTGRPHSFPVENGAKLSGENSIIGRSLVIFDESGQNPVGCCVIGHAADDVTGGRQERNEPRLGGQGSFDIADKPSASASIFGNRPFFSNQNKGLSFGSRNSPKRFSGMFDLSFSDFSNLGSHPFQKTDFHGVLSPSLHHLDQPPSPPQFPGRKGFLGRSPLFGTSSPDNKNAASEAFGAGFNSIPSFSEEEKFIPTDGQDRSADADNEPRQKERDGDNYSDNADRGRAEGDGSSSDRGRISEDRKDPEERDGTQDERYYDKQEQNGPSRDDDKEVINNEYRSTDDNRGSESPTYETRPSNNVEPADRSRNDEGENRPNGDVYEDVASSHAAPNTERNVNIDEGDRIADRRDTTSSGPIGNDVSLTTSHNANDISSHAQVAESPSSARSGSDSVDNKINSGQYHPSSQTGGDRFESPSQNSDVTSYTRNSPDEQLSQVSSAPHVTYTTDPTRYVEPVQASLPYAAADSDSVSTARKDH